MLKDKHKNHIGMRFLYKPHSGTIWGFNNFWCTKDYFPKKNRMKIPKTSYNMINPIALQRTSTNIEKIHPMDSMLVI